MVDVQKTGDEIGEKRSEKKRERESKKITGYKGRFSRMNGVSG